MEGDANRKIAPSTEPTKGTSWNKFERLESFYTQKKVQERFVICSKTSVGLSGLIRHVAF